MVEWPPGSPTCWRRSTARPSRPRVGSGGPPARPPGDHRRLRSRLGAFVDERRMAKVRAWCDWVDASCQSRTGGVPARRLRGTTSCGTGSTTIVGVVDFEEASIGDFHYDLRYLPAQIATLDLLHEIVEAYAERTGRTVTRFTEK